MADALISVRVQPGARRSELVGWRGETLVVRVRAPAVEGRANEAALQLLAVALGVARGRLTILRGANSRLKVVEVQGLDGEQARERLAASGASN
ncbi:MAG: DUF167 domain-containing protein [Chloroflexi bacterium]|nr:DUF167 domain-containing protein [Chloroflexota bacterium]